MENETDRSPVCRNCGSEDLYSQETGSTWGDLEVVTDENGETDAEVINVRGDEHWETTGFICGACTTTAETFAALTEEQPPEPDELAAILGNFAPAT